MKCCLSALVCALLWAVPSQAAIDCTSVNYHTISAAASPNVTTPIDTTGANIIFVSVSSQTTLTGDVSDSKTNTWTELTEKGTADADIAIFYSKNPTVGSGHTFTFTFVAGLNGVIAVLACSGADTSSPFDVEQGNTAASGTTVQPNSVAPGSNNEVVVTAATAGGGGSPTWAIDDGGTAGSFAISDSVGNAGANYAHAMAYKVQTTAVAENPTWSLWGSSASAAVIGTFKAAAAGGASSRNGTLTKIGP